MSKEETQVVAEYDRIVGMAQDELDKEKAQYDREAHQTRIKNAYRDSKEKIVEQKRALIAERQKLNNTTSGTYSISEVIKMQRLIEHIQKDQGMMVAEYKHLFGEELA
jgi:hypothetical protein